MEGKTKSQMNVLQIQWSNENQAKEGLWHIFIKDIACHFFMYLALSNHTQTMYVSGVNRWCLQ